MAIVRFVSGTGASSATIKWYTSSPWSHVEFWTPNGYLGARLAGGVQLRPFDYDASQIATQEFRRWDLAPDKELALEQWLAAQIGKDYDWLAILALPLHRDWKTEDDWFCSELVAAAFNKVGCPILSPHTIVSKITPRDIALSVMLAPCPTPPGVLG